MIMKIEYIMAIAMDKLIRLKYKIKNMIINTPNIDSSSGVLNNPIELSIIQKKSSSTNH